MQAEDDMAGASRSKDLVVFMIRQDATCDECGEELYGGSLLRLERGKALCMECADLDHLHFLPRGNTAVTRRASKYSRLRVIVLRWSRTRKQYERQGILAEEEAIARAEEESLADQDLRERRRERDAERRAEEDAQFIADFAAAIRRQFPACPKGAEMAIARHACQKHSGRVGRSAAAKQLDPEMVRLAVIAHIRHNCTNYDRLMTSYLDRHEARQAVRGAVEERLRKWEGRG